MLAVSCSRRAAICCCPDVKVPNTWSHTATALRTCSTSAVAGSRWERLAAHAGRGGVLDSPSTKIGKVTSPQAATGRKKPPIYKVLLHNDNFNRREYVVKILLKIVEGMTVDDAVNVMQEAHETGLALVVACAQDQAENYVEGLRLNGLISSLEPGH